MEKHSFTHQTTKLCLLLANMDLHPKSDADKHLLEARLSELLGETGRAYDTLSFCAILLQNLRSAQ